jgi:O-succinylbenzoate synthase
MAHGVIRNRETLVVRIDTNDSTGYGECYALADPYPYPEFLDGAELVIREQLIPRLLSAHDDLTPARLEALNQGIRGNKMAKSAVETALLDARLRAAGMSMADFLGATRRRVVAGVSLPLMSDMSALVEKASHALEEGYLRLKFRIAPGFDIDAIRAVRGLGDHFSLHVDANGAYNAEHMDHLSRLDGLGLDMLEQPFEPDNLRAHELLARRMSTPICLDESITSANAAADAILRGAAAMVALKPLRVGGFLESRRVHEVCRVLDVPMFCSGMLESGLSLAGNLALAGLPNFTLAADLWSPERYFEQDFVAPYPLSDGTFAIPDGPGLGVEILHDVLDTLTVSTHEARR